MTSEELRAKYEAAVEKVEKRKNIIIKACKKAGVNADDVFNAHYAFVTNYKADYLRDKETRALLDGIVDDSGKYYDDPETQIIESLPKLYDVEKVAYNWKVKLDAQINKESVEKIPAIWDFLTEWENKARDWYLKNAEYYVKLLNEFQDIVVEFLSERDYKNLSREEKLAVANEFNAYMKSMYGIKHRYRRGTVDEEDYAGKVDAFTKELARVSFVKDGGADSYDYLAYDSNFNVTYGHYVLKGFDIEKLNKILAREKENKYFDLCNRISEVVGEITDARGLSIGRQHGELNGVVDGTKGSARIETIGAGGYNIQCFHYRVLVHKIR